MITRIILSALAFVVFGFINNLYNPIATLVTGKVAGDQFANSDVAYVRTMEIFSFFSAFNSAQTIGLFTILLLIWYKPIKSGIMMALVPVLFGLLLFTPFTTNKALAFAETTDKTEVYTILPNQSAFWVPDVGANKDSQTQFDSEQYYAERKLAVKRFVIPHQKLQGSGGTSFLSGWDFYIPTGRLFLVDRTPYSREWVAQSHRGTSQRDESFPCQTKEGLNVSAGVSIGASVSEDNAAKFLYNFGVIPPKGNPTDPQVIFTSVYYGRSLTDVMDDVGRKKVQTLVCNEVGKRAFDNANADYIPMMESIEKTAKDYFIKMGISINFIGWADTFTFDKDIQQAVNRRYEADKLGPVMATLEATANLKVQEGLAQGLATKGLPMFVSPGIIEGLVHLVPKMAPITPPVK